MAAESGESSSSVIDRLFQAPRRFAFFQAVRMLELAAARGIKDAGFDGSASVGTDVSPHAEAVRFSAQPSLAFPPNEIVDLGRAPSDPTKRGSDGPPRMTVSFFGLTGPSGALPQHYTALLIRNIRAKSLALRDFLDLFNHRLIALFARAGGKYRLPIAYERSPRRTGDPISEALRGIIGFGAEHLRDRTRVGDEVLLHYAGHYYHRSRSAVGLEAVLSDYFGRPVRVEQFWGRWLALSVDELTALPGRRMPEGNYCELGVNATLGEHVWDVQSSFRLRIGPLDYDQFVSFMPEGQDLGRLAELTQLYVGPALSFDVQLTLRLDQVPFCALTREGKFTPRLGWNTWLKHREHLVDASDAVFLRNATEFH
jgi:type VI secretion system protein ImpH